MKKTLISFLIILLSLKCYTQNSDSIYIDSTSFNTQTFKYNIDTTKKYYVDKLSDTTAAIYYAPKWHDCFTNIPGDFVETGKILFSKKSILPASIILGSSILLYIFDKPLVDGVQKFSRNIGLNPDSRFESFIKVGDLDIMQIPGNLNTGFYFIGEGWTSVLLMGGIGIHGAITNNKKELRILSQFIEGYIELGIVTQILKRSFGRETPDVATTDRGKFRPFPSFGNYQNQMPYYDAMPSGHMATMVFTVTLLADNYPNKKWILPLGYSLIGICSFSMMNNGVHWASDYPLGWGIGYLFAKIVSKRGRILQNVVKPNSIFSKIDLTPTLLFNGTTGVRLSLKL